MANFQRSFSKTSVFEGGYANNPNDKGGETYRGIARNHHPKWAGWKIIDTYSKIGAEGSYLNKLCDGNDELQELVAQFYEGGKNG